MEQNLKGLRAQGLGVAAISYDQVSTLKDFANRRRITYPMLSDPDSKIIRAFGILNESVAKDTPQYGIPHPGTYIVDPRGKVVAKYFEDDYRERDTVSGILAERYGAEAGQSRTVTETKHLKISASASANVVHPGQHIALTIHVDLNPKMHVYAPGVQGYTPIAWSMAESVLGKPSPVTYPDSKTLHLPAIDETVPVYLGSFRLVREITIGPEAQVRPLLTAGGELVLDGTFLYQACDDRTCYLPQKVPLQWTLRFEPLDRDRVPPELQRKADSKK